MKKKFVAAVVTMALASALAVLVARPAKGSHLATNGLIAFESYVPSPTGNVYQLFTINSNGTGLHQVTNIPAVANDDVDPGAQDPNFSPDGTTLLFDSDYQASTGNPVNLFTVKGDGTGLTKVPLQVGGYYGPPAYSPNGRRLAVGASLNNHDGLWLVQLSNGSVRRLGHGGGGAPTWSPNGKWIAFHRPKSGSQSLGAIFLIRPNGTNLHRLTPWKLDASYPNWSANGKRIVFDSYGDEGATRTANLFTIKPSGKGLKQLTHYCCGNLTSSHAFHPAWSPDSRQIVYEGPQAAIWIINANGSNPRQLTHMQYNSAAPAWGPAG